MRRLREWAPMIAVMLGMLMFGLRILLLSTPTIAQDSTSTPASSTATSTSGQSTLTATTGGVTATASPTSGDVAVTPTASLTPGAALQPTNTPQEVAPPPTPNAEQPAPPPTLELPPTPTSTPEGESIPCQPGTVAELLGQGTPSAQLLVYLQSNRAGSAVGSGAVFRSSGVLLDSGGGPGSGGDDGGEVPTIAPGGGSAGGSAGRVVGSGFIDAGGNFRLALAIQTLKSGRYPLEVRDRGTQQKLASYTCEVGGPAPTPLSITPGATPAPNPGNLLFCGTGYLLQLTGQGTPRTALAVSFDGNEIAGATVLADGTYNIPLLFGQQRPGSYRVIVSERNSRKILTQFLCLVPVTPTITPRNDRP